VGLNSINASLSLVRDNRHTKQISIQPYGGFPDNVRVAGGHIVMPELPGIGFEGKSDLIKVMRELAG
jgi:hypothetical protein